MASIILITWGIYQGAYLYPSNEARRLFKLKNGDENITFYCNLTENTTHFYFKKQNKYTPLKVVSLI